MEYRALLQIALIGISVLLVFIYIKPTFETIGVTQDQLYEVQTKVANAEEFNQVLDELVRVENSYSDSDRRDLELFLPTSLDTPQIMRDIESLLEDYEVRIDKMSAMPAVTPEPEITVEGEEVYGGPILASQDFTVDVSGTYEDLKEILSLLETNAYPLEVVEMGIKVTEPDEFVRDGTRMVSFFNEDDLFTIEMVLRAHALRIN